MSYCNFKHWLLFNFILITVLRLEQVAVLIIQGVNTYFLSIIKRKGNINPLARLIIKDIHIYLNGNKKNQRYFF